MVAKVSRRVHGDFTHVVRCGRTSALGSAEALLLLDGASHGPAGRWLLLQRVRYPGFPLAGQARPVMVLPARDGPGLGLSGAAQTNRCR